MEKTQSSGDWRATWDGKVGSMHPSCMSTIYLPSPKLSLPSAPSLPLLLNVQEKRRDESIAEKLRWTGRSEKEGLNGYRGPFILGEGGNENK